MNENKVLEIRKNEDRILIAVYKDTETTIYKTLTNENIKSIVTKETYSNAEYRVETN